MARLALAAMLLAALAPAVSRTLAAAPAAHGTETTVAVELCTATGLRTILVADHHEETGTPHDPDEACDYCSLVVPPPVALLLVRDLILPLPATPAFRQRIAAGHAFRNMRGLGAQAPPMMA
ncbi:MAG: DUF2946 family protein [Pseudomonadota bacterium]|nr:DUF2946 family protein [Pseudomonadota bacterium]